MSMFNVESTKLSQDGLTPSHDVVFPVQHTHIIHRLLLQAVGGGHHPALADDGGSAVDTAQGDVDESHHHGVLVHLRLLATDYSCLQ